jgi:hypothetical protein
MIKVHYTEIFFFFLTFFHRTFSLSTGLLRGYRHALHILMNSEIHCLALHLSLSVSISFLPSFSGTAILNAQ